MTEYEALNEFNKMLVETGTTITVYGVEFDSARILRELDHIAYREMFNNWLDSEEIKIEEWIDD